MGAVAMSEARSQTGSRIRKWILIGIAAPLVLIPIGLFIGFAVFVWEISGQPHQPDAKMMANFQKHKQDFEQLRQMILQDKGLTRVDDDWTNPEDPKVLGVTPERIAQYRRIFGRLGIPRGFSADPERSRIEFIASAQGLSISGSMKSYVYSQHSPPGLFDDLNNLPSKENSHGYRRIEGKWYLYFYAD
jgi:hypothetical protein